MKHRNTALALALAALPLLAGAQLSANVSLTSNYKFRGQDQDTIGSRGDPKTGALKPALQGGFDYAFGESGWYVGNWNSTVHWQAGNAIESDLYGGYKWKAGVFDLDVGALTYVYPGNSAGNTTELYGAAGYSDPVLGAFTLKYSHTVSRDYFGYAGSAAGSGLKGRNTGYLNLAYSREIAPKVTLKAALGYTHLSGDIRGRGYPSFADYGVGIAYDFGNGLSLAGAVQGATRQGAYATAYGVLGERSFSPNRARAVVTLTKTL